MNVLPYSERVLRPESSCEAKSLALMVLRDVWGCDLLTDDLEARNRIGRVADTAMRRWDTDHDQDIPALVEELVRCDWCRGKGYLPDAPLGVDCQHCAGEGHRL